MWIRNNWLRPSDSKLPEIFDEVGFDNLDSMSQAIIIGYHYYLNDTLYELKPRE